MMNDEAWDWWSKWGTTVGCASILLVAGVALGVFPPDVPTPAVPSEQAQFVTSPVPTPDSLLGWIGSAMLVYAIIWGAQTLLGLVLLAIVAAIIIHARKTGTA